MIMSFAALMLYTMRALERIRECGADLLCQLNVMWEYTLVVMVAVLFVLMLVDVILRLGEAPRRELSLYHYAAYYSAGGET